MPSTAKLRIAGAPIDVPNPLTHTDDIATVISQRKPANLDVADLKGRQLAHFEIVETIGVGGMGAVLKAVDLALGRIVALKILPPDLANDEEHLRRFRLEARAAARLDHENIAQVFFCGTESGLHFIAFEYVEGEDLKTLLARRGPPTVDHAARCMLQIAKGLEHSASRGVVHRDIKPSNVIVTPDGKAKIVDMGLARLEGPTDAVTRSGATLGTYDYISPEQALEPRLADIRSDIYSLGCTFYHWLTGHAPVPEGTAAKKLHFHQTIQPPDPRLYNRALPEIFVDVLAKSMAKSPEDRYQSPTELVEDLELMIDQLNSTKMPRATKTRSTGKPRSAISPIPRWLVLGSVLAVILLIGALEWFFAPLHRAPPINASPTAVTDTEKLNRP